MNRVILLFLSSLLISCATTLQPTGETAQAVSEASNAVQATSIEEVVTNNINIPLGYMLLMMAACTFVPNPFQMVGRAFEMLFGGVLKVWRLFKGD